jgi:enoyl-CoA hydratase/carnithine racemase
MAENLLVENHGPVRVVTLNRPTQRNAVDMALRESLAGAVNNAMADNVVRVLVLTGAGEIFSAGGDVAVMPGATSAQTRLRITALQQVVMAICDGPKPVVAAVEGGAFGTGLGVMAACDRVVASSSARFGATFARIGLAGDAGVFWSLPRRVGSARAKQLLLMAAEVSASEAATIGLVDALAEPGQALWAALSDAARLAAGPPLALASIKYMFNFGSANLRAVLDAETERQAALCDTEDFGEGLAALRERRPPTFRGR